MRGKGRWILNPFATGGIVALNALSIVQFHQSFFLHAQGESDLVVKVMDTIPPAVDIVIVVVRGWISGPSIWKGVEPVCINFLAHHGREEQEEHAGSDPFTLCHLRIGSAAKCEEAQAKAGGIVPNLARFLSALSVSLFLTSSLPPDLTFAKP